MKRRILEIGCGDGFNSFILSKDKDNEVTGIDISKESISTSKKRYPKISFFVMDSERTSFQKSYFDEIYALDVLEHVDNLETVLNEVRRILKKRGKFIINVPYSKSEKWLLKVRPTYHEEIHHVRIFKEKELDSLMRKRKFVLKERSKRGFLQHVELYFLFKRKIDSKNQTSIGSWRDNPWTVALHAGLLYFDPSVVHTPLVYFPIWVITIPLGFTINWVGSKFFPKSLYYEFVKL